MSAVNKSPGNSPVTVLAFDYGIKRIGVACGNTLTQSARPLKTLNQGSQLMWDEIDAIVKDYTPSKFIVGLPYNMDGTETTLTQTVRNFASQLEQRFNHEVVLVDERLSSHAATAELRDARASGQQRKRVARADIDMTAAKVLLEQWLHQPQ
jgi:putative holliday junction resolvase